MRHTRRAALAFAAAVPAGSVFAQGGHPGKPVRTIVPYPAGGLSDFQVRAGAAAQGTSPAASGEAVRAGPVRRGRLIRETGFNAE